MAQISVLISLNHEGIYVLHSVSFHFLPNRNGDANANEIAWLAVQSLSVFFPFQLKSQMSSINNLRNRNIILENRNYFSNHKRFIVSFQKAINNRFNGLTTNIGHVAKYKSMTDWGIWNRFIFKEIGHRLSSSIVLNGFEWFSLFCFALVAWFSPMLNSSIRLTDCSKYRTS